MRLKYSCRHMVARFTVRDYKVFLSQHNEIYQHLRTIECFTGWRAGKFALNSSYTEAFIFSHMVSAFIFLATEIINPSRLKLFLFNLQLAIKEQQHSISTRKQVSLEISDTLLLKERGREEIHLWRTYYMLQSLLDIFYVCKHVSSF